jgi:hypothetical protein
MIRKMPENKDEIDLEDWSLHRYPLTTPKDAQKHLAARERVISPSNCNPTRSNVTVETLRTV